VSLAVFVAVLAAAVLHAGWNAVVKAAEDKAAATRFVAIGAGAVGLAAAPFLAAPAAASLPWLAASVALQILYFLLLARAYRLADLTVVYPVMRGLAPMFVVAATAPAFAEQLGLVARLGVVAVCLGLVGLVVGRPIDRRGLLAAVATAAVIAGYTVLDGVGVRLSGAPIGYAAWEAILTAVPFVLREVVRAPPSLGSRRPAALVFGLLGGLATTVAWTIALWAMTQAPIALVAALRETSIVFALVIGRVVFGEPIGPVRALAAAIVVAGIMALRAG
jgi:drug/metabolite transporter (DMT)-like permease